MLEIPRFIVPRFKRNPRVTSALFAKSGFDRMHVFPEISKMAFLDDSLDDAEHPRFVVLLFKMNPMVTPTFFLKSGFE